jgi:hypothetical protein
MLHICKLKLQPKLQAKCKVQTINQNVLFELHHKKFHCCEKISKTAPTLNQTRKKSQLSHFLNLSILLREGGGWNREK